MASIKLTVNTNFAEASKDIRSLGKLTEAETKRMDKGLKNLSTESLDRFERNLKRSTAAVKATKGPTEALVHQQRALSTQIQRSIKAGIDPLDSSLEKLQKEYKRVNKQLAANTKAQQINEKAVRSATIALGALAVAGAALAMRGVRDFSAYSKGLANVNTMIDISAKEFKALDKEITTLSNDFAIQKKELSGGVYQALSAGAKDLGEALTIVEASAKLSKGAIVDNTRAVDIVTTAMNAYGKETVSASDAIDTYFTIIKQGKINGEQLSATIGQSISLFAAAKIPIDELGAGIATLTKVGVQASEATTQLNGIVNAFIKPSEAMSAALKEIGFSSGSALLESEGLAGAIEFLMNAGDGTIDSMAELVPNIRGLRGALAAAAQDGETFNDVLEAFQTKSGAADEALLRQIDGFAKDAFTIDQAKIAMENLSITLGEKIIPTIGKAAAAITEFITNTEKMKKTLNVILPILAALTAGLASFIVITKVIAIIKGLSTAMAVLNAVLAANPAILIATAIAAVVAAIVILIRNWDVAVVLFETTVEKLQTRFQMFGTIISTAWIKAFNNIKIVVLELGKTVIDKLLGSIQEFLDLAAKLPFVGDKFADLSNNVDGMKKSLELARLEAIRNSKDTIAAAEASKDAIIAVSKQNMAAISAEKDARLAALKVMEEESIDFSENYKNIVEDQEKEANKIIAGSLEDRLEILNNAEAIANNARIATFQEFLKARMEQEGIGADDRLEFLEDEQVRVMELETLNYDERKAAQDAFNLAKIEAEKDTGDKIVSSIMSFNSIIARMQADFAKRQRAQIEGMWLLVTQTGEVTGSVLSSISDFFSIYAGESSKAAKAVKVLAHAQAGINAALAFTQVLADATLPWWLKVPKAGAILAAGIAQQISIDRTPIPSAETGGRFTVPEAAGASRADNVGMNVNPGETVTVSPRGEAAGSMVTVNNYLDREVMWSVTQEGLDAGEIQVNNDNIREAV